MNAAPFTDTELDMIRHGDMLGPELGQRVGAALSAHPRTGYTTVDPSEGEQAKPGYPDPVAETARRCAEIALEDRTPGYGQHRTDMEALAEIQRKNIADRIGREFGLLPSSET